MRSTARQTVVRRPTGDDLLAAARFAVPPASSLHVRRPHLTAALAQAPDLPLVLVSAPAGTGKTAAVAEWVRDERGDASWITFEEEETAFWPPVLETLRRRGLDVPTSWVATTSGCLGSQRLTDLARLVVGATERLTVVVDGYELASLELAREVDYLLRHSMGRLCLVLVGRVDPVLPLYRYRLTDSMMEIRATDLAFSDEEAVRLMGSARVELADEAVHQLNHRVRGWAVGLRFAARALAGSSDPEDRLATALEQTSDINEYLVGEVLNAQTPDVRRLLLDTSVADVFSLELTELLGGASAVRTMEGLVARSAFVEPVPGLSGWFRYYPFFRSFLQAQLAYESPERMVEVRRLASRWLRGEGQHVQALTQLAAIGAWGEMAAHIVDEGLVGRLLLEERGGALEGLALRLPADVTLPAACVVRAVVALREGESGKDRCRRELAAARRVGREDRPLDRLVSVSIAAVDAFMNAFTGPAGAAADLAAEAERLLGEPPSALPGPSTSELAVVIAFSRGLADLRRGHLADAGTAFARAVSQEPLDVATGSRADCLGYLALTDALRGELSRASKRAQESFAVAAQAGLSRLDVSPSAHVAMAWVGVERSEPDLVREHVALAGATRTLPAHPTCTRLLEASTAALEQADGHLKSAADRLAATADAAASSDPWIADLVRVEAARLAVRTGDPDEALGLLASVHDPELPDVLVTTEAAYAEQGTPRPVEELQEKVDTAEASLSAQVRAHLCEAALTSHRRSAAEAGPALSRALRLATKERMSRPFREAAPSTRRVMAAHPRLLQEHDWLRPVAQTGPSPRWADIHRGLPVVVEPLTVKELEVLGHLGELLSTDEIAQTMFVSVNTVRTHIRNILRKLGVNRRNAAIRRARDLGILDNGTALIHHG